MPAIQIIDVNLSNVDELGFFCCMSKPDSAGHEEKLAWVKERFREGLRIKMIQRGGRGFIEYMPGKMAWKGIDAPAYMVIHCLWVVGRAKGKGAGTALLDACIRDAQAAKLQGVAMVAARGKVGLVDTEFFTHQGFHVAESTSSGMDLVVLKFNAANADPHFVNDLKKKAKSLGDGLTIVSSPQCPYTYEAAQQIVSLAHAEKIPALSLRVNTLAQLRQTSPSPYASFDMVYNGEVVSNLFHCMTAGKLRKLIAKRGR
jgi:L-amino acid N-acyltransferase YncA